MKHFRKYKAHPDGIYAKVIPLGEGKMIIIQCLNIREQMKLY